MIAAHADQHISDEQCLDALADRAIIAIRSESDIHAEPDSFPLLRNPDGETGVGNHVCRVDRAVLLREAQTAVRSGRASLP